MDRMPPGRLLDEALWAFPFSRQSCGTPRTCLSADPDDASGYSWMKWPGSGKSATLLRLRLDYG